MPVIQPPFDHAPTGAGDSDFVRRYLKNYNGSLRFGEFNVTVATESRDYISIWRLGQSVAGRYRLHALRIS